MAGPDPVRRTLRLPLVAVDSEQRAVIRDALDAVGVPVAS